MLRARSTRKSAVQMNCNGQSLLSFCRICEKLLSRRSRRRRKHAEALKGAFDVDVTTDQAELHPPDICERCRMITQRWKSSISTGRQYRPSQKAVAWEHHESGSCFAGEMHSKNVKGGRPQRSELRYWDNLSATLRKLSNGFCTPWLCLPSNDHPYSTRISYGNTITRMNWRFFFARCAKTS